MQCLPTALFSFTYSCYHPLQFDLSHLEVKPHSFACNEVVKYEVAAISRKIVIALIFLWGTMIEPSAERLMRSRREVSVVVANTFSAMASLIAQLDIIRSSTIISLSASDSRMKELRLLNGRERGMKRTLSRYKRSS